MANKPKPPSKRSLIFGVFFVFFGLIMFAGLYDQILDAGMNQAFQISESSPLYPAWVEMPIPLKSQVNLYQIENRRQFMNGAKPIMSQHGPFTFKATDLSRVEFYEKLRFVYSPLANEEDVDQPLYLMNMVYTMALGLVRSILTEWHINFLNPVVSNVLNAAFRLTGETLIEQRTPREFLKGRKIQLFSLLDQILKPLKQLGLPVPGIKVGDANLIDGHFGFILIRELDETGPFEIFTGHKGLSKFNYYASSKGKDVIDAYKDPPCNSLFGSDGSFFGRNLPPNKSLAIFNPNMCRLFELEFLRITKEFGIRVYEYTIATNSFDQRVRKNQCFCSHSDKRKCHGFTDVSRCFDGAPIAMTFPHFTLSEHLLDKIGSGLTPDKKLLSRIYIEPTLGITIKASVRMQINVQMQPVPLVSGLNKLPTMVLPLLWIEEGAEIDQALQWGLWIGINFIKHGSNGFLLVSLFGIYMIYNYFKRQKQFRHFKSKIRSQTMISYNQKPIKHIMNDNLSESHYEDVHSIHRRRSLKDS